MQSRVSTVIKLSLTSMFAGAMSVGIVGMIFGLIVGIVTENLVIVILGTLIGCIVGLLAGTFLALLLTVVFTGLNSAAPEDSKVESKEKIEFLGSFGDAFTLCKQAIQQLPNTKIDASHSDDSKLKAVKSSSWKSWGELITCTVERMDDNRQLITVESRPALKTTVFDYGTNEDNVKTITSFLEKQSKISLLGSFEEELLSDTTGTNLTELANDKSINDKID